MFSHQGKHSIVTDKCKKMTVFMDITCAWIKSTEFCNSQLVYTNDIFCIHTSVFSAGIIILI